MNKLQFSVLINATKEKVWATLWEDNTFRDWSNLIDEGSYMVGELKEGNEIQFISGSSGYGVTSLVDKLAPKEFVLFRHKADTKDSGQKERADEWTGGSESYLLSEANGVTTLTVNIDVPPEQEELFKNIFPKALGRIKTLAEKS
jgi:hypothetical protein